MVDVAVSQSASPRSGYTLPVFACAGAMAALQRLLQPEVTVPTVTLDLINPAQAATIPVDQLAPLPDGSVLAITHSDPGDNLDLTRHTPIWSVVAWGLPDQPEPIQIQGGEGIGRQGSDGQAAIYRYARQLILHHLSVRLPEGKTLRVIIILPQGRTLAERTSNAAFGIVDGLSLLGTTGISAPLSAPGQLEQFRQILAQKAQIHRVLVFCVGENGLDLAVKLGIDPDCRLKTANWLGPLLVEAGLQRLDGVLLLGHHGKLIKLAGGIYHTHHHVADGRQEILTAYAGAAGVPGPVLKQILDSPTAEAGLEQVRSLGTDWVAQVYGTIASQIDRRASAYVHTHTGTPLTVGCLLFDRSRQILMVSPVGQGLLQKVLIH